MARPEPARLLHGVTLADLKARTRRGTGGCWLWTGNRHANGYARLTHKGRTLFVHRLAYVLAKGTVPKEMSLLRTCGHAHCINPAHMRPVTREQIVRRMLKAGAFARGSGHPGSKLTEAEVRRIRRVYAAGKRSCGALAREYGVDSTLILRIVQRKRWRHVT